VEVRKGERFPSHALLTSFEAGRRNRRTGDGVMLALGAIVVALAAAIASGAPAEDRKVAHSLVNVLGWAEALWRTLFVAALVLAVVVIADVLFRRRWALLRDIVAVLALEAGVAILLHRAVESGWSPVDNHLLSSWGFPELRIAWTTGVIVIVGPELVRPVRRFAAALVPLAAFSVIVLGAALPASALAALAFGLGAAAVVRLVFGTAAGVPPSERIRGELAALGIVTNDLQPAERQRIGSAQYVGTDAGGQAIRVRVLGRDAQDTQRLARLWRQLAYRDPRRSVAVGRVEQVEHEAVATLLAAQAGVRVPQVVTAALGPAGDALIVTHRSETEPLELSDPGKVSDALLDQVWVETGRLHSAGISHGRLNLGNVELADGKPLLVDLSVATLGAPRTAIDIDVAELLVACTVLVGPDRALNAACAGPGTQAVAAALPYMERAALTPHLRDLAHDHDLELKQLREAAAKETGTKLPELVSVRRVRPRDFLFTGLVAVAAYLLITKLAKIGFGTIASELRHSELAWVGVALILAQLTYIPQAIALQGAVETPIPLLPTILLQSADKFLNLTVPGSAGSLALTVRFLQRLGAPTGEALSASAIQGLSETLLQIALVLILIPVTHFKLNTSQLAGAVPPGRFIAVIFAVLAIAVVVAVAVPAVRRRVVPPIRQALHSLEIVARTPRKLAQLFGGALAKNIVFALTLGASSLAYGVHIGLAQLILVNVIASSLASLVPVPGGIGAAEAAIAGGLVAIGVPESVAFAIALTHRLCTYYLPPVWGYFALSWLRRKGHV
jgi:uncharacterized membrane protein YbhN (UPF0104 family)/tRNA A-37 threonylcarbamoyl transferase component Bud32